MCMMFAGTLSYAFFQVGVGPGLGGLGRGATNLNRPLLIFLGSSPSQPHMVSRIGGNGGGCRMSTHEQSIAVFFAVLAPEDSKFSLRGEDDIPLV